MWGALLHATLKALEQRSEQEPAQEPPPESFEDLAEESQGWVITPLNPAVYLADLLHTCICASPITIQNCKTAVICQMVATIDAVPPHSTQV